MHNPSIVRAAFAPEQAHELSLEAVLILESIGCAFITGGSPGLRDAVLVWLAITDLSALKKARRAGTITELAEAWSVDKRPADLIALQGTIKASLEAAMAPADSGEDTSADADDPLASIQKKTAADAVGG